MRFCPICGKKGIKGDFCEGCRPKEEASFKDIVVPVCVVCNKFRLDNKWKDSANIQDSIAAIAKKRIKNPQRKQLIIEPATKDLTPKPGLDVDISLKVSLGKDRYEIPATVKFTYCTRCGKKDSGYYEGILQLRDVRDEVTEFVDNKIKKAKGIFCTRRDEVKNGIDFYITNKHFMKNLGYELKKRFKGDLKENAQHFSRDKQTSKNIYRLNVVFRQS